MGLGTAMSEIDERLNERKKINLGDWKLNIFFYLKSGNCL